MTINVSVCLCTFRRLSLSATLEGLAGQVLPSGANGEVTITGAGDNCAFDLRMVFSDGDVIEDSTDLCAASGYTIN